eukprot:snap_masked-scaffold_6-processed-gene-8.35-mRNA-1 protein AED:1.00 eAED:1.00 QI:0/-1/0/0/-1/1/1/0/407
MENLIKCLVYVWQQIPGYYPKTLQNATELTDIPAQEMLKNSNNLDNLNPVHNNQFHANQILWKVEGIVLKVKVTNEAVSVGKQVLRFSSSTISVVQFDWTESVKQEDIDEICTKLEEFTSITSVKFNSAVKIWPIVKLLKRLLEKLNVRRVSLPFFQFDLSSATDFLELVNVLDSNFVVNNVSLKAFILLGTIPKYAASSLKICGKLFSLSKHQELKKQYFPLFRKYVFYSKLRFLSTLKLDFTEDLIDIYSFSNFDDLKTLKRLEVSRDTLKNVEPGLMYSFCKFMSGLNSLEVLLFQNLSPLSSHDFSCISFLLREFVLTIVKNIKIKELLIKMRRRFDLVGMQNFFEPLRTLKPWERKFSMIKKVPAPEKRLFFSRSFEYVALELKSGMSSRRYMRLNSFILNV